MLVILILPFITSKMREASIDFLTHFRNRSSSDTSSSQRCERLSHTVRTIHVSLFPKNMTTTRLASLIKNEFYRKIEIFNCEASPNVAFERIFPSSTTSKVCRLPSQTHEKRELNPSTALRKSNSVIISLLY